MRAGERLTQLLRSPRVIACAVGIAILLNLPSLGGGWQLDDLTHRAQFLEVGPMTDSSDMTNRMFDFLRGDAEEIRAWKDLGVLPWWGNDALKLAFWRPRSSFTHVVDYTLWPHSGPAMHAHSLLWLGAMVTMVGILYRRMLTGSIVGLAVLLYALDDAHGISAGWLANRNAVVAATFGFASLIAHDRWRREAWGPGIVVGPIAFLASLLGGESGTGIAAFLFAHALFLDSGKWFDRTRALLPYALVGAAWLLYYKTSGYGTSGSGFYLDPMEETGAFLSAFTTRAPILLLGQWFFPPSTFYFMWSPDQAIGMAIFGIVVILLFAVLLRPILRARPEARFFATGMLVAVIPICATVPHDRLLLYVGFGASGLLSLLLHRAFERTRGWPWRSFGWLLVLVHVMIAAPFQTIFALAPKSIEQTVKGPALGLPDDPELPNQRLVIVNAPSFFYAQGTMLVRRFADRPSPKSLLMLAPGITRVTVHRHAPSAVTVEAEEGYMISSLDDVFRRQSDPIADDISLTGVDITLTKKTTDGRPKAATFTFVADLEDRSLRWVRYEGERLVPFEIPDVGETVVLPAVDFPY